MTGGHRTQLDRSPPVGDEHEGSDHHDGDHHFFNGGDARVVAEARRRGRGRRGGAIDHVRCVGYGSGERTESVASGLWLPAAASFPFSTHARGSAD